MSLHADILAYAIINPKSAPAVPRDEEFSLAFLGNVALTLDSPLTLDSFWFLGSNHRGCCNVTKPERSARCGGHDHGRIPPEREGGGGAPAPPKNKKLMFPPPRPPGRPPL